MGVAKYIKGALETILFAADEGKRPIIPLTWEKGESDLVVIVGPNATGKSVFRRVIGAHYQEDKVEFMGLSMQARTGGSYLGVVRGMIYGDEGHNSTGRNSAGTITTGIHTAQGRDNPHVLFWDEPDVGLSDEYAAGAGQTIASFILDKPKHTKAAFVVTHRRALVKELLVAKPHALIFGEDGPKTLDEWLNREIKPLPIGELAELNHKKFKEIQAELDRHEKEER